MCRGENETTDRERGDDDGSPVSSWRRKLCRHKTWFPFFSKKEKVLGLHQQQQHQQQHNANGRRRLSISRPFLLLLPCCWLFLSFFPYFSYIFSFFSYFNQQQPPLYTLWYLILDFLKLAGTFLFFFLWERGFRRDINVYKVIKFKPGEERKRKKTGISTDRRRRTYIWVRDDQQLYRKHFFKNEQYTQRFRRCFPWPYNEKRMKCWMNFPIKTACLIIKDPPVVVFCFVLYLVERLLL